MASLMAVHGPWPQVVLMLDKLQAKIKAHFALHWHTAHPQQISQAVRKSSAKVVSGRIEKMLSGFLSLTWQTR